MNLSLKETVLITGVSNGIGYELAREFARRGHDLVIVAPVEPELLDVASRISAEHGVGVKAIPSDLRGERAADDIFAQLTANGIAVDILVNNAGLCRHGKLGEMPLDEEISMIRLSIEAGERLTKRFLPAIIERGRGRILNTASMGGLDAGATTEVYHATKAFVLSRSEALAAELEDTGVALTALCLGPVDTDFFSTAQMVDRDIFKDEDVRASQEISVTIYEALMNGAMREDVGTGVETVTQS